MFDLDNFKVVNDTYGHLCGDYTLQAVTALVGNMIRNTGIWTRYGAEEFCCFLPEIDMEKAAVTAERCRRTVEQNLFHSQGITARITISVGVSQMGEEIDMPKN